MIIDCISDLHGNYPNLEGGDLLIIAGDLTATDEIEQYEEFQRWIEVQNYKMKIIVAGNHDNEIEKGLDLHCPNLGIHYLCDSGTEFQGLKIWGSPWTKTFPDMNPSCKAFTCDTEEELTVYFELIPADIDILITHSPPYGILDECSNGHVGSKSLFSFIKYVFRPYLHVFGHIHESYGQIEEFACRDDKYMKSVNASHVNRYYQPVNKPIRVIL